MLVKLTTILECSRIYSLPMTIMSWLVIFTYSAMNSGNILNGILALFGICFAHLAANVLDDFFDYKSLIKQVNFKKSEYLKNTQKTKCRYLICGIITEKEVFELAGIYLLLAVIIGLFLFIKCGVGILYFAAIGGIITLIYSFMSKIMLSEIAVAIAYGPALFGGVYYAMTGTYSINAFIISLPTMFITVILLYIHTLMDFDFDLNEGKKTLANSFNSQLDALILLKIFLICAYSSLILVCIYDIVDWQLFLVFLTIILASDLYKSMFDYAINPDSIPEHKWFHFPMENMAQIKKIKAEPFMLRMYQSRNLMIYFSILFSIAIIIGIS